MRRVGAACASSCGRSAATVMQLGSRPPYVSSPPRTPLKRCRGLSTLSSSNPASSFTPPPAARSPPSPAPPPPPPTFPLRPIKGTHDLLPPYSLRHRRLSTLLSSTSLLHSFSPIHTPILEPAALLSHSLPSSDLVLKELFHFLDHDTPTILRPEGTAPVVRALIHRGGGAGGGGGGGGVERLFYEGPMFRRERPQRGRYRQFTQFGVELVGEGGVQGEVDVLVLAWELMQRLGLQQHVQLQLNSLGDNASRQRYCALLHAALLPHLASLSADSQRRVHAGHVLRVLDSKDEKDRAVVASGSIPLIIDHLSPESRGRFDRLLSALTSLSIPYTLNPTLVRGLDYYTHTAFELLPTQTPLSSSTLCPPASTQSALLAGGRYDGLFALLGGKPRPAVGWALGMERLLLMMGEKGGEEKEEEGGVGVVGVGGAGEGVELGSPVWLEVMTVARDLRRAGLSVSTPLERGSASKQLAWAARANLAACVIVGEDELRDGVVKVKRMRSRQEEAVARADVVSYVQQLANGGV